MHLPGEQCLDGVVHVLPDAPASDGAESFPAAMRSSSSVRSALVGVMSPKVARVRGAPKPNRVPDGKVVSCPEE